MNDIEILLIEIREELKLRICIEGIPRIKKCISLLSEDEVWKIFNNEIPSIGNLILHLNGNVRQWFLDGFCGISFTRYREKEFNVSKSPTKSELLVLLSSLSIDIEYNIHKISYDLLIRKKTIQNHFFVSGYSIINHITEHFSYHTGQIATLTKLCINSDLGFYDDVKL